MILFFLLVHAGISAQYTKPLNVLEAVDMSGFYPAKVTSPSRYTRNSGEALLLLDTAAAYAQEVINVPKSGIYRIDISAKSSNQSSDGIWAAMRLRIDKVNVGSIINVSTTSVQIFSVSTAISKGKHTIEVVSLNNGTQNKYIGRLYLSLLYITKSTEKKPYVFSVIPPSSLERGTILTANHFKSKVLRGFNIGTSIGQTTQNFIDMRATGANLARMWMSLNRTPGIDTFSFSEGALATMDAHIALAAQQEFYVVIVFDPLPNALSQEYWGNSSSAVSLRNSIKKRWVEIANRYKGKSIVAGYDLINEPRYEHYAFWIKWSSELIEAIRSVDPEHAIIIEDSYSDQMYERIIPFPYSNIVYSPHCYSPLKITHQGIIGKERLEYPLNTESPIQGAYSKQNLYQSFLEIKTLVDRFNVPVFVGEFSCINWAPKNSSGQWSSTEWINDRISFMEAQNWSWTYHAWREFEGWDAEIPSSLYENYTYENARPIIKKSAQRAARTTEASTIVMLRDWFKFNPPINFSITKTNGK